QITRRSSFFIACPASPPQPLLEQVHAELQDLAAHPGDPADAEDLGGAGASLVDLDGDAADVVAFAHGADGELEVDEEGLALERELAKEGAAKHVDAVHGALGADGHAHDLAQALAQKEAKAAVDLAPLGVVADDHVGAVL